MPHAPKPARVSSRHSTCTDDRAPGCTSQTCIPSPTALSSQHGAWASAAVLWVHRWVLLPPTHSLEHLKDLFQLMPPALSTVNASQTFSTWLCPSV